MHDLVLTPDNLQLSRVNKSEASVEVAEHFAIYCKPDLFLSAAASSLSDAAVDLLSYACAPNTMRAYESDLRHYRDWGGTLPAAPAEICAYIGDHAGQLAVGTILRRIATLSKAHSAANLPNPCKTEIVKSTIRGLKRKHGTAQRQARPLLRDELFLVLDQMGDGLRDQRDRALLLMGFAGGFRRSELVALERCHLENTRQGIIVTLERSKTDQEAAGRRIGIPHGRTRHCPVAAVESWLSASCIRNGFVALFVLRAYLPLPWGVVSACGWSRACRVL